ncbi:1,2-phenylacetyl-CoA epoxidase subunit PaaC [Variovorax sp. Sphag1AA]|uniref:1,2-phenylacetyl-CoA epoxidase subunit PaaC n=1 Tax=Variovorax sp. Sphag1AA TaxID=2587027 RepID=UPI00160CB274|nr:1,2-phenylacetyl-CoA epoxidase subunit PaaC [Variovorax sp. Sphag1AA]MBB3180752.1 ring-1,2-phenylacetyl-CoA epoxidase subunit PaaC [Variovorax sp. Sphag1AA]
MQASIAVDLQPIVQYLLRIGDTCLIHAQRLSEWSGHAPILEEDIAMSNMALDLIGQSRAVLTLAGELEGQGHDEDQLAFLRQEKDFRNLTMVELPRGDFAFTVMRNAMMATLMKLLWERLHESSNAELSAIAGKAIKEARYHQQHAADWVVRLGDSTDEARQRIEKALRDLWLYVPELFESDAIDEAASADGIGPRWSDLKAKWLEEMNTILDEATLKRPEDAAFRSTGKNGVHSEHMGYILTEMQYLQRAYPGGVW